MFFNLNIRTEENHGNKSLINGHNSIMQSIQKTIKRSRTKCFKSQLNYIKEIKFIIHLEPGIYWWQSDRGIKKIKQRDNSSS